MVTQTAPGEPTETWWVYAIMGVLSILFGLALIIWPALTVGVFIFLFGIYAVLFGIVSLIDMFRRMGAHQTWWPQLIIGLVGIGAGIYVFSNPTITALLLIYAIAFWAIAVGLMEIFASFATGKFLLLIVGALTIGFGFILLANPTAGALALALVIGVFSIIQGILLLFHAFSAPTTPAVPV
jgi:uncharacterized membrane protein HdeD (DUF308 family)